MKIATHILSILAIMVLFAGCKKPPTACFTVNQSSVAVNSKIVCDGRCSKNAKIFNWLGTGIKIPGNELNSIDTIIYNMPGTYTIKLEVINSGKTDITSVNVHVY